MQALVLTPGTTHRLAFAEVADPEPAANEVVIEVATAGVNIGDISSLAWEGWAEPGSIAGWDAAGTVVQAADDGSGPPVGTMVVSYEPARGWAERRAVVTTEVAAIPAGVDLETAAAIPVAGVTALRSLRQSGALLGRRVLITGASGAVGRFAVQLAARAGAHVVAQSRRTAGLAELGAHEVVTSLDEIDPIDVVIDNVGGPQLVQAWLALKPGGLVQSVGGTSSQDATFPVYSTIGSGKSLASFGAGSAFGPDISYLLELVAKGELQVVIGWRGSWKRFDDAFDATAGGQMLGKAILDID